MLWAGMQEDEVIESKVVSKAIEYSQQKVEKNNFEVRKHLLEYDDVLNQQRKVIYGYRRDVLEGEDRIYDLIRDMIVGAVQETIGMFSLARSITPQNIELVYAHLSKITGLPLVDFQDQGFHQSNVELFATGLIEFLSNRYAAYRDQEKIEIVRNAEKWLLLEVIDQAWKMHMVNLEHLKEGIGLRGYGQKNPLIEYKREAFLMFQDMMQQIKFDVLHHIFHLNLDRFDAHELEQKREKELMDLQLAGTEEGGSSSIVKQSQAQQPRTVENKVGRNDVCPCGSGQKFKKCHGK
jgi:preprotein translocase subunit SecA